MPSASAQSCHLNWCCGSSGVSATQGVRKASATMAPCIASATTSSLCSMASSTCSTGQRGSMKNRSACRATDTQSARSRLWKWGMKARLCGAGTAHSIDPPARVERRLGRIAAIAGAEHQLHDVIRMVIEQDRSDAEHQRIVAAVEHPVEQARHQEMVELVPEIRRLPPI